MGFVHLHNHSSFSLLDGLTTPMELVVLAKRYGMPAVALTDHGNLFAAYKFYKACKEQSVKPILGEEFYITQDHTKKEKRTKTSHVVLLATNATGWKNLMFLHTTAFLEGFYYKPRIDPALVSKHREGLIAMSACCSGIIGKHALADDYAKASDMAKWFQSTFGKDFYLEIMPLEFDEQRKLNLVIAKISQETGIKMVATVDSHYPDKEDWKAHEVLLKIRNADFTISSRDLWFRTEQEMIDGFKELYADDELDYMNAIETTMEVADKVEEFSIEPEYHVPVLSELGGHV